MTVAIQYNLLRSQHKGRQLPSCEETAREFAMTFVGPVVLASWAALAEDRDARRQALEEAEAILETGCVGHNYFWFADTAIDDALVNGEWDRAERYARMLGDYMRDQPLPWGILMVERARTLAAWNRDGPREDLIGSIETLIRQANAAKLNSAIPLLKEALDR
jgi:hypothetical protein